MANLLGRSARERVRNGCRLGRFLVAVLVFLASLLAAPALHAQGTVEYLYDELGRLKAVVAPSGERAEYDYDTAGNLIAIRRLGSAALTISEFTPNAGPAGTLVTIFGSGFSATPASNTVRFNGSVAAVTGASTTQLQVTAPASGTTGPISVTVGAATATSSENFTYTTGGVFGAPTITNFTPDNGVAGSSITITGTNFDTAPGATRVELNGNVFAQITSITATQIVATVPSNAGSGVIRVVTPRGVAASANDFIVPPVGYSYVDIISRTRAAVGGGAASLNIGTANKHGMALFDGSVGQFVSLQFSVVSTSGPNVPYKVFDPNNIQVASNQISASQPTIHVPRLPKTGTYTVIFSPGAATASVTFNVVQDQTIVMDGSPISVSTGGAYQKTRVVFSAQGGQNFGIGFTGLAINPGTGNTARLFVYRPDGGQLDTTWCYTTNPDAGCGVKFANLTQAGFYSIIVDTSNTTTISAGTLTLSSDVTGTLAAGTPFSLNVARKGQNGRLTFSGTAGQAATLFVDNLETGPVVNKPVTITLSRNDTGAQVASAIAEPFRDGATIYVPSLPVTGTYTVFVDPSFALTSTATVKLNPAADIVSNGASVNVSTSVPGYAMRLHFAGTAGQNLGLGLSGLTYNLASNSGTGLTVYRPDGSQFANSPCYTNSPDSGCSVNLSNLPTTGTYAIVVNPPSDRTISAGTLTLSSDVTGTLAAGTPFSLNVARKGQNGRLTFSGTAGQAATLFVDNLETGPVVNKPVTITLSRNDTGAQVASAIAEPFRDGATIYVPSLPVTGTYTVFVDPSFALTSTATVKLNPAADIVSNGASVNVSTSVPGYAMRLHFAGTAGQNLGLGLSGLTYNLASNSGTGLTVYRPDGSQFANSPCYTNSPDSGCSVNLSNLPTTGTYAIVVNPPSDRTISAGTLTLSSDLTGTLTVGGAPTAVNVNRKGRNARYTFSGTAGQLRRLNVTSLATTPASQSVTYRVLKPDGTELGSTTTPGPTASYDIPALPSSGTYTIFIDPYFAATATMNIQVVTR